MVGNIIFTLPCRIMKSTCSEQFAAIVAKVWILNVYLIVIFEIEIVNHLSCLGCLPFLRIM